ncbi:MAG: helix-turn-helix domain-containing protein [Candidatus Gastranaerophilales bacterium]|nr:helix-turn-helix domain-containing protein [Candidatus Gastranaerophilales bacterium]
MKIKIKETVKIKKGWSLYKLAQVLNLPQQTVYSWASGRTQPSYENMDKLCETIGCAIGDLLEAEPVQQKLNLAVNQ